MGTASTASTAARLKMSAPPGPKPTTLINDATQARMQARLPQWYVQGINAPAFLLLPLQIKGQPFALIYADQSAPGGIVVDDKVLGLLRTLRNQAVMAFRQAG